MPQNKPRNSPHSCNQESMYVLASNLLRGVAHGIAHDLAHGKMTAVQSLSLNTALEAITAASSGIILALAVHREGVHNLEFDLDYTPEEGAKELVRTVDKTIGEFFGDSEGEEPNLPPDTIPPTGGGLPN